MHNKLSLRPHPTYRIYSILSRKISLMIRANILAVVFFLPHKYVYRLFISNLPFFFFKYERVPSFWVTQYDRYSFYGFCSLNSSIISSTNTKIASHIYEWYRNTNRCSFDQNCQTFNERYESVSEWRNN